ncbi:MAG: methyltransferase domain-containing protein [Clostridia bacterium]|nr:methyltransferase domain-containing protein [Clostridia bacterium]
MPYELKSARYLARDILLRAVRPGDTVVDATMGNGHDTLFLAGQVGPEGHVYAFDIQADAVESTRKLLAEQNLSDRVTLLCRSHAELVEAVPAGVAAVVFNLGWLPGGDHSITTLCASTEKAVSAALEILKPGGVVTVCAYPGHAEGTRELEMLTDRLASLSNREYNVLRHTFLNAGPGAPECFVIQKNF